MATYQELMDAARKADANGDGPAAKRFLELAKQAQPDPNWRDQPIPEGMAYNAKTGQVEDLRSPINPNIPQGKAAAAGIGAGQGLGFGTFDEAVAAGNAAISGKGYPYELGRMREADRRAQQDHPGMYYGGMIPGAVASSVDGWAALGIKGAGKGLLNTIGRGSAMGGVEGGMFGFGSGEGTRDRLNKMLTGAGFGALVGGAAPVAVAGGAKAINAAGDVIGGGVSTVTGKARQGAANRALMDTLRKSGQTMDQVSADVSRAAREGQPEFRTMDALGKAGQRRASGIVRSGGDGAEQLGQFLDQRQVDQADRVGAFVSDAFDANKTAKQATGDLTAARKAAADTAYASARQNAGSVDLTNAIGKIDDLLKRDPILGDNPLSAGAYGSRLKSIRSRMTNDKSQLIDFESVLQLKSDLYKLKGTKSWGDVQPVYNELDKALEAASPNYRAANDGFRTASKVIDAVDQGQGMARPGTRAADNVQTYSGMTPDEQTAARIGYGDRALAKIEASSSPTANRAKAFTSTKAKAEADAMATDPQLFANRIARENQMWETQNRALGGSRTADNQMDIRDTGALSGIGRAIGSALHGNFGQAAGQIGGVVTPMVTGQNEATRALIAKMLMSSDPQQALASALRQESTNQGRRQIAEAFARAIGRPITN